MKFNTVQLIAFLNDDKWWIAQVFLVVLTTVTVNFAANRLLDKLRQKAKETTTAWDNALLASAHRPLSSLIWLLGIASLPTSRGNRATPPYSTSSTRYAELASS